MPKIEYVGIADAKPPQPPKDGVHPLRIMKATHKRSKSGKMMTEVMISVEDDAEAPPLYEYLMDPISQSEWEENMSKKEDSGIDQMSDSEKLVQYNKGENMKLLNTQRILVAFDIGFDETGFDTDSFPSHTATLELRNREPDSQGRINTQIMYPQPAV